MKFTIIVELPNKKSLASNIELTQEQWDEYGFAPIPPVQEKTLLQDSQRNTKQRMKRKRNIAKLMERLGKRALEIINM